MNKSQRLKNMGKPNNKKNMLTHYAEKWRTIVALVLMFLVIYFEQEWGWGLLFLVWVIPDLFRGVTYFVEPVRRDTHPLLYWVIIISWILLSVYSLSPLFINYY